MSGNFGQPTAVSFRYFVAAASAFISAVALVERLVVRREIDRVDAIAFDIAVKKIAFAQFEFRFYSAQSLQFSCVSGTSLFQRWAGVGVLATFVPGFSIAYPTVCFDSRGDAAVG